MIGPAQPLLLALKRSLDQAKLRKLVQHASLTLPWLVVIALVLTWWGLGSRYIVGACLGGFIISMLMATRSQAYRALTLANLTAHANRQYAQLEESCQLLLADTAALNITQRLQQTRVATSLTTLLNQQATALVPNYPLGKGLWATFLLTLCATLIWQGNLFTPSALIDPELQLGNPLPTDETVATTSVLAAQVYITPPNYAAHIYPARQQDNLDIRVLTGSQVTWQLSFADPEQNYFIHFANSQKKALVKRQTNDFQLTTHISQSSVYQISSEDGQVLGLYSIEVVADDKPKIHFIAPLATITELATDAKPVVDSQVQISDDIGLGNIQIVASIAKGSGEGVKFRDQVFEFDRHQRINGQEHYFKRWQLVDLGMEPGDELYFKIKVWDNRQPQPQLSRSLTKIIRWLEDTPQTVLSDGTMVNFVPEYFKSQRQIIIETEQLLAEKPQLSPAQFKQTSQQLGQAQSDLKHKYGQFLGDEVDDGAGGHAMEDGLGTPQIQTKDGEHGEGEQQHEVVSEHVGGAHQHQQPASNNLAADKSGLAATIAQYGHAHGDTDIGNIGQQNPKAMMKRAIANMWRAEAQLLQNVPEMALPYEKQALVWLNRAKNAERIYVKRLGFEPPPVSEKRRYEGDLTDILSYRHEAQTPAEESDSRHLAALLQRMNHGQGFLSPSDVELITAAKKVLNGRLAQRPGLIEHVTTLQKMILANHWQPVNCKNCKRNLQAELWQLLPRAVAAPAPRQLDYANSSPGITSYAEFLRHQPRYTSP